ncbi:MAG: DUF1971 domain-containing protein, partial [Ilumatobacter sp.]|nr:DUF1971 domain-containing protein [Ilumatobacter sp.]
MCTAPRSLPDGLHLVRTTREFDETTVPSGLLREHRIAEGVWGRLVVRDGALTFVFDGETASPSSLVTA